MDPDYRSESERGLRAKQLLEDPVFTAAVQECRRQYVQDWELAPTPQAREALWHRIHALADVERQLLALVFNGEHAAARLNR